MSVLPRLPMTVISGYLGAGKTTLINRLLAEDHGLRLLVLVNDFGAINIDADLIAAAGDDSIALTNGCVCCTMGADLFMALGDALDRRPRPDHLIVEASGIADPAAIANAAIAEPELLHGGVVTLVDALNAGGLLEDAQIGPQLARQIDVADLVLVTKTAGLPADLRRRLAELGARDPVVLAEDMTTAPLVLGTLPLPRQTGRAPHPAYASWAHEGGSLPDRAALEALLRRRPGGLYRLKGRVATGDGGFAVQVVGRQVDIRPVEAGRTALVGLGPADRVSREEIDRWWTSGA